MPVSANEMGTKILEMFDIPNVDIASVAIWLEAGQSAKIISTRLVREEKVQKVYELLQTMTAEEITDVEVKSETPLSAADTPETPTE